MSEFYNNEEEDTVKKSNMIIGFILGIGAIICCFIPVLGLIIGIVGYIINRNGFRNRKLFNMIGMVFSVIGAIICIILLIRNNYVGVSSDKRKLFRDSSNDVEVWINDNRDNSLITDICGNDLEDCLNEMVLFRVGNGSDILSNSGLYSFDFDLNSSYYEIKNDGVCVVLYGSSTGKYAGIRRASKSSGCK